VGKDDEEQKHAKEVMGELFHASCASTRCSDACCVFEEGQDKNKKIALQGRETMTDFVTRLTK
jgi:hypothetical protein